jgi:pimeloyl-ACP methyl ester carboxylesterase
MMATFRYASDAGEVEIHYEERGSGFPILLIAPGGMQSTIDYWEKTPWNPIEHLSGSYRVVAMDQRNAGDSTAPITARDGWHVYTEDQLRLMDHLGVERFHVAGMCIGGPYCMGLIERAPERVASAVLFQPIGLSDNRQAFLGMFDDWAKSLAPDHAHLTASDWNAFRESMYGGDDFLFNVDDDFVSSCSTPLLVLMGSDLYHPEETSRRIAKLAPNVRLVERWKEGEDIAPARQTVDDFLASNS